MNKLHALLYTTFAFAFSSGYFAAARNYLSPGPDSTTVGFELARFVSSNDRTPFWLRANQFGTVPTASPASLIRLSADHLRGNAAPGGVRWKLGLEMVANVSGKPGMLLPQAHAGLQYKNWEIFVGRKKQWVGLADSTLGTGSYAWSTNAMPIPKIQIGTSRFVALPLSGGWLSFHAFYSEGFFERGRPVTSHLKLHQKALYFRIGKADSRVRLFGGFNHQVQWGGRSPYETTGGKMPTGLKNYYRIITGKPGDASAEPNSFDNGNRVGNHLGTVDLGIEIESYALSLFFYRQNVYEDGTLYSLRNIKDGLNGFRLRRKNSYGANFEITECVFEFLYTKSQGGGEYDYDGQIVHRGSLGKDDYFNNAQIRDGWSYNNRSIGTPFITPTTETIWAKPQYADFFTSNNRVSVYHVGLKGTLFRKINWITKCSYSSNWGTYDQPFKISTRQFSGSIVFQTRFNAAGSTDISAGFSADAGALFPKTYGGMLKITKAFTFPQKQRP